jgi:hypothetical protein
MIPPRQSRRQRAPRRGMVIASATMITALALTGGTALVRLEAHAQRPETEAMVRTVDLTLGGGPGCEPIRTAQLVRGNGVGSTASGPDVILAFQHAYYVARSGSLARMVTAPDAWVSQAEVIDVGIATVPVGTRHCVQITPLPDGRFDVQVTETRPDQTVRMYRELVTVSMRHGATMITRIDPAR